MTMAETGSNNLQCFNCDARFENSQEFWDHIYNVDCGADRNEASFPKENVKPVSSPVDPELHGAGDRGEVSQKESLPSGKAFACGLCNTSFDSSSDLYAHTQSSAHRERVASAANRYVTANNSKKGPNKWLTTDPQQPLFCKECQVPLPSVAAREAHISGKKHQKVMAQLAQKNNPGSARQAISPGPSDVTQAYNDDGLEQPRLFCEYCQVTLSDRQAAAQHLNSSSHLAAMKRHGNTSVSTVQESRTDQLDSLQTYLTPLSDSNLAELNTLLRRLCLTQLLALMRGLDGAVSENNEPTVSSPSEKTIAGVNEHDLLQLFRAICREELQNLLSHTKML